MHTGHAESFRAANIGDLKSGGLRWPRWGHRQGLGRAAQSWGVVGGARLGARRVGRRECERRL